VRALLLSIIGIAAPMLIPTAAGPAVSQQPEVIDAGRAVYMRSCAGCHGEAATGYGPAAWVLTRRPPDLTLYRDRTVPFPRERIRNTITGHIRYVPGPAPNEMPLWRSGLGANVGEGTLTEMDALLAYLEHLQVRPYGPTKGISAASLAAAGQPLYQTHCAACHNAAAAAPDLTRLTDRHPGADLALTVELIARRHGNADDEMPSWQKAFERAGWPQVTIAANLRAIAQYVLSMQTR
jgi:mono/diheme cytochrome c family protein